ncbi:MAG: SMC-Scp complex subunit ScpB [Puniceicoccaceae bacterium]
MEFDIKSWLKALLFSTSDPLDIKQIQWVYNRVREQQLEERERQSAGESESETPSHVGFPVLLTSSSIREAMGELEREFESRGEVYRLLSTKDGYRLCVAPEYGEWVRALRGETKPLRLSQAALETLAIIAYRQPVTRAEMERIRGVSVDSALSRLLELDLVISRGRAELPGRPLQYGTTDKFMDFCGLESLSDLPTSDIVSSDKLDEWVNRPSNEFEDGQESLDLKV